MPRQKRPLATEIGERLAAAREGLELLQEEVAERLGITVEAYGSYERGWHVVPIRVLLKLPDVLQRPVHYFLGLPDPEGLNDQERQLIEAFRSIETPAIRDLVLQMAYQQAALDNRLLGRDPTDSRPWGKTVPVPDDRS